MASTILEYNPESIPLELRANPHHPSADKYIQQLKEIQQAIVLVSSEMTPKTTQVIKRWHKCETKTQITKEMNSSQSFVSKAIASPMGKKLLALLSFYQEALDGPVEAQRRAMLWRIAHDTEERAPKTSISAIVELNRMADMGKNLNQGNTTVNIHIDQSTLPKTTLDA